MVISTKIDYSEKAFSSFSSISSLYKNVEEERLVVLRSLPLYNQFNYLRVALTFAIEKAREFKPDIIHASIGYPGAILGYLLSRKIKIPFVFTEHTRPINNFRSYWHKSTSVAGMKRATTVMAVSHSLAHEIAPLIKKKPVVIPNIVNIQKYERVRPSTDNVPQFGFIGGMNTPVKGLDILLRAVAQIDQPFCLHVCGDGTLKQTYVDLANSLGLGKKCTFYGFIDPERMPDFFARLHFLICSSRYETFNVSLIEAMACGMPVVSTRCGGPEDFVSADNGILCEREDPDSLRDAIGKMLSHYHTFNQRKLIEFAGRFAPEKVVLQVEKIYLDACKIWL
jgi:glycosyltransferase involved in cell wall biosynthesis